LHQYYEDNQLAVFSEILHQYNSKFNMTEMIILITSSSLYLLDRKCNIKSRVDLADLREIILVKANACMFALSFAKGLPPLILQSFRRAELMIYVLSQRERSNPKPRVVFGDALRVTLRSGKTLHLDFDKAMKNRGALSATSKKVMETSQLNNFVNAIACGYLEKQSKGLFGGSKWTRFFVVLSNIGLLYFKDVLEPPVDLFPILNCVLVDVDPEEVSGSTTVFRLEHGRKKATFKCVSLSEYEIWKKAVVQLQQDTENKSKTLKAKELARMTELQRQVL